MHCRFCLALTILLISAVGVPTQADASAEPASTHRAEVRFVLRTSELRSAYLLRAGIVRYDAASPHGVCRQLQRHFDVVLGLLLAGTPASIETALDRLEASQAASWSETDRAIWRRRLLFNRYQQFRRLMAYRDRGLFPQNEGQSYDPTPIFVDEHNTACAVAHLMRISDHRHEVASIVTSNNLIHVPDIVGGPIASWILTSGLTLEEAALIQPGYNTRRLAPIPDDAIELTSQLSGDFGDLRFSNFRTFREADDVEMPSVNIPVSHTFCNYFECANVALFVPNAELDLTSARQLVLTDAASDAVDSSNLALPASIEVFGGEFARVLIQFDVEVVSPSQRIVGRPHASTLFSNSVTLWGANQISLFVSGDQDHFFIDNPARNPGVPGDVHLYSGKRALLGNETDRFQLKKHLTVVTELLLRNGQSHQSQILHFSVVTIPEPATCLLLMIGAVSMFGRFRRNNRS